MFIFDGPNKRIRLDNSAIVNGTVTFTLEELWSRYIDWYLTDDNSKYLPALRTTGGDYIGNGQYIGNYLFLRNDLGWRGVPPDYDGVTVIINGGFYGEDANLPVMENNPGQETDLVINRSSMVTNTAPGGSGTLDLTDVLSKLANIENKLQKVATKNDVIAAAMI